MIRTLPAFALAATLTVALTGCATRADGQAGGRCRDTVRVNHRATERTAELKVSPGVARVCMGTTVRIEFYPPVTAGRGETEPKPNNPDWLEGSTGELQPILISVPDDVTSGQEFHYLLRVMDVGVLDPTFIIR